MARGRTTGFTSGYTFTTKRSGRATLLEYRQAPGRGSMALVEFENTKRQLWITYEALRKGMAVDVYAPTVNGVGYLGDGPFSPTTHKRVYNMWNNLLGRTHGPRCAELHATYKGCSVVPRWWNFQLFAKDVTAMRNFDKAGFDLDKDLRCIGNRVYGPETCSFVPRAVNNFARPNLDTRTTLGITENSNGTIAKTFTVRLGRVHETFTTRKAAVQFRRKLQRDTALTLAKKFRKVLHPDVYRNLMNHHWR